MTTTLPRDASAQAIPYFGYDGVNNILLLSGGGGSPAAFALSDAMDNPTTTLPGAANALFDAVSGKWHRWWSASSLGDGSSGSTSASMVPYYSGVSGYEVSRTANQAAGANGTGLLGVAPLIWNGSVYNKVFTAGNTGDANGGDTAPVSPSMLYNGSGWDRQRNNLEGQLLASAARTAQTDSATQTNYNARGVRVFLRVSAASGTGGLQIGVYVVDPVSGLSTRINVLPTAVTATGLATYAFYPAVTTSDNSNYNQILGRTWFCRVIVGDASSYTYSVGYSLLP